MPATPTPTSTPTSRRRLPRFGYGAGGAALAVLAAALWLGPSAALKSTGLLVVLALAWPFLFALGSFLVLGVIAVVVPGEGAGDAGEAGIEAGVEGGRFYYRLLLSIRSPVFWGAFAGAVLSVGGLYAFVESSVRPREEAALAQLDRLSAALQADRERTGSYPGPRGAYLHEALGLSSTDTWREEPLADPWGHPILYQVEKDDAGERFRVASAGWNGRDEVGHGDDLVLEGESPSEGGFLRRAGRWVKGLFEDEEEE